MSLTLTLKPKEDVYVDHQRVVLAAIESLHTAILTTATGGKTVINPYEWTKVEGIPGLEAMMGQSRETDREQSLLEARLQFSAPGKLILRGEKYRKGKQQ